MKQDKVFNSYFGIEAIMTDTTCIQFKKSQI